MTDGKTQAQILLDAVLPFAEKMLAEHGEFFPLAGALSPSGEVVSVGGHDGREHPPSTEIIELLASGLRQGANSGEYVATALVYDVRVTPPTATEPTDAIAAELEHQDGYAVTVFFPYRLANGQPELASPFATAQSRAIFSMAG
ncbi:hypothetical protein [Mesorhizobium sp. WSM2239]|uniref:Uncharacterized protein n=2 Tax=unclassified Mesorhizobium TaxID=325217 RepID=A0AAU8DCB8_9HYPH